MHEKKIFEAVYNEIVFSECDEKVFKNLIAFLEDEKFTLTNKSEDKAGHDKYHFEKQGEIFKKMSKLLHR